MRVQASYNAGWPTQLGKFGMAERYNEGKAIDAVLRRIEVREAAARLCDGRSPDDQQDPDPKRRVDYVCTVGKQLYAFEHTGIEPFPNQIKIQVDNEKLFAPVMARFDNHISAAEYWELHVPVEVSVGLSGGKIKRVQDAVIDWIDANAAALPVKRFGDRLPYKADRESILDVPFRFAVYRYSIPESSPMSRRFWRREFISGSLEAQRMTRLQQTCRDKFAKLAVWKRDEGARSVLVMEENDISSTNAELVFHAMMRAEAGKPDTPDEIYLVSTFLPDVWRVTCLRRFGKNYYDDGERFHELEPASLTQLTKR